LPFVVKRDTVHQLTIQVLTGVVLQSALEPMEDEPFRSTHRNVCGKPFTNTRSPPRIWPPEENAPAFSTSKVTEAEISFRAANFSLETRPSFSSSLNVVRS